MNIFNREFRYYSGKPVMVLIPVGRDNGFRWFVKLEDLWKYSDTHNDLFESFIINKIIQLCGVEYDREGNPIGYDIPVPKGETLFAQFMSSISDTIMGGIDELVQMPPFRAGYDDPKMVIDMQPVSDMLDIKVGMMS
jgi:hypothetical protein